MTVVDYPAGVVSGTASVVRVEPHGEHWAVVTDRTPFHPVDNTWPDQPADAGSLDTRPVLDCQVGAIADGQLVVAPQVRRGEPGYEWVVVHVVAEPPEVGAKVALEVDPGRRAALSRAHTACHVSALALNAVIADLWRKQVAVDGLGNPDFDRLALVSSRMEPDVARDTYRLGKSLRKKGFDTAAMTADLDGVAQRVQSLVAEWIAADGQVRIEADGPALTDMRWWVCDVPAGQYRIPCGGTHVRSLGDLGAVLVHYEVPEEGSVMAVTEVRLGENDR